MGVSLHRFPSDPQYRRIWTAAVKHTRAKWAEHSMVLWVEHTLSQHTLQKKKRKTFSKKETQNHILGHWEDNFNCCMVGPRISQFCAVGQRWPKSLLQKWRPWGPTIQQLTLSSQCHQYVVLRFFFWMWFCVSFFEMVLRFFFWRVYFDRGLYHQFDLTIKQMLLPDAVPNIFPLSKKAKVPQKKRGAFEKRERIMVSLSRIVLTWTWSCQGWRNTVACALFNHLAPQTSLLEFSA